MAKVTIKKIELEMNVKKNTCKLVLHGSDKRKYTLIMPDSGALIAVGEID